MVLLYALQLVFEDMIVKLDQTVQINGSEISELNLELEKLKGKDIVDLETGFRQMYRGEYIPVLNLDIRYQAFVAGRVCGINPEDLGELYAPDFEEVCSQVQNFLLKTGSFTKKSLPPQQKPLEK